MKPILVPYDENMTKEELLKAIADAVGSDVETVKKELCEPKDEPQTDSEITRNSLRKDCNGCRFVGSYDTEFPCANCTRKNKDYYTSEQTEREGE